MRLTLLQPNSGRLWLHLKCITRWHTSSPSAPLIHAQLSAFRFQPYVTMQQTQSECVNNSSDAIGARPVQANAFFTLVNAACCSAVSDFGSASPVFNNIFCSGLSDVGNCTSKCMIRSPKPPFPSGSPPPATVFVYPGLRGHARVQNVSFTSSSDSIVDQPQRSGASFSQGTVCGEQGHASC